MIYGFESIEDICRQFEIEKIEGRVLYADYTYESYDGSAFVVFYNNGQLYSVSGGHCSCYGLGGQWSPEETTPQVILHMIREGQHGTISGNKTLEMLIERYVTLKDASVSDEEMDCLMSL